MALVSLHNGVRSARLWLSTSVTTTAKASGKMGSATFSIPRTSRIWSAGIIRHDGGNLVQIGDFAGITDRPQWDDDGAQIRALEVGQWVGVRIPPRARAFRACPASVIARAAILDGFIGSGVLPVTIGPCAVSPPLIREYRFDGRKTVKGILTDMVNETGQEWAIDGRTYEFRWQPQIGRYHEGTIVDLGELIDDLKLSDLTERFQQVTETDRRTKRSFTAWNGTTPPLWPAQTTLEV
jgi:hypothetical protein